MDEYQDTNVLQAEILQRLRPTGEGLTVVGDDAQSIYSFRAASVDNILNFKDAISRTRQSWCWRRTTAPRSRCWMRPTR